LSGPPKGPATSSGITDLLRFLKHVRTERNAVMLRVPLVASLVEPAPSPGTLVAVVVIRHRRFGPSSTGHDLGTDRAMPASAVHAPARAGPTTTRLPRS
jgi:hypothetical protein